MEIQALSVFGPEDDKTTVFNVESTKRPNLSLVFKQTLSSACGKHLTRSPNQSS